MAKYPFLSETGEYFRSQHLSLEDFGTAPDLAPFVEKAYERVLCARDGRPYRPGAGGSGGGGGGGATAEAALQKEIFSFLLAVVLIKLSKSNMLVHRFSMQEARTAERLLESDLKVSGAPSGRIYLTRDRLHARSLAAAIIHDISKVRISAPAESRLSQGASVAEGDDWTVPVFDYVTRAVHFHEQEWDLVNRRVHGGAVFLTSHEVVRLVRKEIEGFIRARMNSMAASEVYPNFERHVRELTEWARANQPRYVESSEYPPCIRHAIDTLERGENLPHSGRFMLATYLLQRGQSVAEIAPLFRNAPDYNERVTTYQLRNIAGESGGTRYSCPSCEKVRSHDLCFAVPACDHITTPLQFGRKRAR